MLILANKQNVVLGVIVVLIAALVIPSPWRLPAATNDEMLHLKSWRNRYGTNDVFPIGRRKIEKATNIPEGIKQIALKIYDSSPLGQRLFIVLQDCHPSIWPITAEIVASITNSSLIAIRLISTAAFAVALFLVFRIGEHLADRTVGILLAAFWAMSHLALEYAGLARMYACALAALLFFFYVYHKRDPQNDKDFAAISLWALLPVSLEWFTWPAVYTLLAVAIWRRAPTINGISDLWKRYKYLIPFVVVCTVWMAYYVVLAKLHPSRSPEWSAEKGPHPAYEHFMDFFGRVGIASFLLPTAKMSCEAIAFVNLLVLAVGLAVFAARPRLPMYLRTAVVFLAVAGLVLPNVIRMLARHYLLTLAVPITMSYFALALLIPPRIRLVISVILLACGLTIASTQQKFLGKDNPAYEFPDIARVVKDVLGDDQYWIASPYQIAMCIYRYEHLPEPQLPSSKRELTDTLDQMPCDRDVIVLCHRWTPSGLDESHRRLFEQGVMLHEFESGIAIFKIRKVCHQEYRD